MGSLITYVLRDVVRSRFVIVYGLVFIAISELLIRFVGIDRVLPALINVVVPLVPLISVVFAMSYVYHAVPTVEMLLSQPVKRRSVYAGLYVGLVGPLAVVPALGLGLPMLLRSGTAAATFPAASVLIVAVALLAAVFGGIGFWTAVRFRDRVGGLSFALFLWLFLAVGYDGLVLYASHAFSDYPIEGPLLVAMALNPIDLARVALLTVTDLSALLGYTGAVFMRFFGSALGIVIVAAASALWVAVPVLAGLRRFVARDF